MQKKMNGFSLIRSRTLSEIGGTIHEMEHDKTGAKLVWLERPDDNKTFGIAFTTLPEDSTGVFHILEHSVLCGSDKYPVKEPFVELLKNSMNTFLNAMTFPDKTFYPISSRNDKDFMNLMRVYLDAVFRPLIYSKPEIFYQEGWHYEFDENGAPSYKGVVFNEMKGAYASADQQLSSAVMEMLYPDTCYRFSSGGDPEVIPDLSYETFLNFHRRYYSPSNSFILLDGDIDIDRVLAVIDGEYLSELAASEKIAPPAVQESINGGIRRISYELSAEEALEGKMRMAWAGVVGTYADRQTLTAMQILSQLLCGSNQAPVSRAILEKGLAEDVVMQVQDGVLQPWVQLEVQNFAESNLTLVEETVMQELKRLATEGLDREQIVAIMANMEFRLRERDYGTMPRGLVFGINVLESWLYGGDPAANLEVGDLFDSLREKMEQGYFEELLRRMLLENPHACKIVMEPSHTIGEQRRQKEQLRLTEEAGVWSPEEREALVSRQERIQAWQESVDTPESLATLPILTLADITAEPEWIPTEVTDCFGIPVLKHEEACGGIVYCTLYFDCADLSEEKLSLASQLCTLLGELGTAGSTSEQLMNRKHLLCGMLQFNISTFGKENRPDQCQRKLSVSFSALESKLPEALALVTEILTQTKFTDENEVLNILRQNRTALSQQIIMSGATVALGRVAAHSAVSGVVGECTSGFRFYQWLKEQEENWNWEPLRAGLEQLCEMVFCRERLTLSVTGTLKDCANTVAQALSKALPEGTQAVCCPLTPWGKRKEGIVIPADISFALKGGNILEQGGSYNGTLPLAARIVSLGYLWNTIRVQGGAYGTGLVARASGLACCYSYRDPNAQRSLEQYNGAAEFLKGLCAEQMDLTGFIIGAVSDDSPLLTPRMRGMVADNYYWSDISEDLLIQRRKELLEASYADLSGAADVLFNVMASGGVCVIGSQQQIDACELDSVFTL